jgi:hypothetical protein
MGLPLLHLSKTHQTHTRSYRVSCPSSPLPTRIAGLYATGVRKQGPTLHFNSLFLKYGFHYNMLSGPVLLFHLFLKYCFHIFLIYRLIRKRPRRRRLRPPTRAVAATPRPLPPGGAADSAETGASLATLRSV